MTEAESQLALSHDAAVAALNASIDRTRGAREHCHHQVRGALAGKVPTDTIEDILLMIDGFHASLEANFNMILALKVIHPAAWDASEGGISARAYEAEIERFVTESLATAFGLRSSGAPEVE